MREPDWQLATDEVNGAAIQYADKELLNDKSLMKKAVKANGEVRFHILQSKRERSAFGSYTARPGTSEIHLTRVFSSVAIQ